MGRRRARRAVQLRHPSSHPKLTPASLLRPMDYAVEIHNKTIRDNRWSRTCFPGAPLLWINFIKISVGRGLLNRMT